MKPRGLEGGGGRERWWDLAGTAVCGEAGEEWPCLENVESE